MSENITETTNAIPDVLVVEPDEFRRRRQVLSLLREGSYAIAAATGSKREAMAALRRLRPAFAVINVRLPDGNGADVIREVLRANAQAHVLVATDEKDESTVMQAIAAGADGYMLYGDSPMNTAECLSLMSSGGSPVSPVIARSVLRALHMRTNAAIAAPANCPLSARELDILRLLAKGINFAQISEILAISEHTVTTHVKKIYHKLNVHSRGEAVYEARQMHYID